MNAIARWADTIAADSRVLLVVNSQPFRRDEIERTLTAIAERTDVSHVSCIAPASLRSWLIQLGLSGANILPARLHGQDLELAFFLESPRAIRWALERNATVVLGSEPYAPNNEEVKDAFEQRAAALLGAASYVAHSLPGDRVFCFDVQELWMRAARHESMARHHARVQSGMAALERGWKDGAPIDTSLVSGEMVGQDLDANQPVIVDASKHTYDRLSRALAEGHDERRGVRMLVSPAGRWPSAKGLPAKIEPVTRPGEIASGVRWHRTRLAVRGVGGGCIPACWCRARRNSLSEMPPWLKARSTQAASPSDSSVATNGPRALTLMIPARSQPSPSRPSADFTNLLSPTA